MQEIIIKVAGMVCQGCENRVKNAVSSIQGVEAVLAEHATGKVTVKANESVKQEVIEAKIEDIGFSIENSK